MSHAMPAGNAADRNLLFGILAVQMDFISRDALIAAMNTWVLAKHRPLGELLQEGGALTPERRALLDALTDEHLRAHNGDCPGSIAAVANKSTLCDLAQSVTDSALDALLAAIGNQSAPTMDVRPPTVEGMRYQVLRPHARGGLGLVSIARDIELGREVALKEMKEYADDAGHRGRFVREAEITGGLEHPGIVPVYGLGQYADGRPYYAMRFIRGETLQEAGRKLHAGEPGYTLRGLLTRFVAVCNAVGYAHSRGVIHRDLKPANVMLGSYGETLVVDWGLAKVVGRAEAAVRVEQRGEVTLQVGAGDGSATRAGSLLGTPAFMSPEQARGETDALTQATDVYGLGATLYALLTGRPPVTGDDALQLLEQVWQGNWPPPRQVKPSIPAALDAICCKAMSLRPENRYQSALDLAADVERWLSDEPVIAWREPVAVRLWRWARRHRTLVTGTAAALMVGVVSLGTAAVLLAAANGRERAATQSAERQRDRANANFQLAREAVDHFYAQVSQSAEMKARGAEKLRTGLLQGAVQFYERLLQDEGEGSVEQIRAENARSLRRLASLLDDIGKTTESEQRFRQAESLSRQLASASPAESAYRVDLAATLSGLGMFYARLARRDEGEAILKEACDLRRELADSDPPTPERLDDLAGILGNLGALYSEWGRYAQAETAYRQAIEIGRRLAAEYPDRIEFQVRYAKSLFGLGLIYRFSDRWTEAEGPGKDACDLYRRLAAAHPDIPEYGFGLANTSWHLGFLFSRSGRRADAEAAYSEAVGGFRALVESHPGVTEYQRDLAGSLEGQAELLRSGGQFAQALAIYDEITRRLDLLLVAEPRRTNTWLILSRADTGRAVTLAEAGRPAEAVPAWTRAAESCRRAAELSQGPQRSWLQVRQANALIQAGRPLEGAVLASEMAPAARGPDTLYDFACVLSLGSTAAVRSAALPPLSSTPLSEYFAATAVANLRRAIAAGYKDFAQMKRDSDLDPLRGRPDFQAVMSSVEAKAK
jgi:eukaryotic-like serine/threonine-protein kinase